jgi:hypothetical protein
MNKKHFLTAFSLIAFGSLTIPLSAQWADTDGDGARDDWEVQNGSDPLSAASFPKPASKKVNVKAFTNIEESGISPNKTYTHAISGGSSVTVNSVIFNELTPNSTPANFSWDTSGDGNKGSGVALNDWNTDASGITDNDLNSLLSGFTYSIQRWSSLTAPQKYTLNGLTKGQLYEVRFYIRVWDKFNSCCPVDLIFSNGNEIVQPWGALPINRPDYVLGNQNRDSAFYISFRYRARKNDLVVDASMNPNLPWGSGSFHMYAMTNEVVQDTDGDGLSDYEEINVYHTDPSKADTDGDGLRDDEEINVNHTDPNKADTDGDGFLDNYEILSGKSPLDAADKPALLAEARTAIEFSFPSALGKSYQIQASTDLNTWTVVEDSVAGTGEGITRFYSTRNQPRRFFRVEEISAL